MEEILKEIDAEIHRTYCRLRNTGDYTCNGVMDGLEKAKMIVQKHLKVQANGDKN